MPELSALDCRSLKATGSLLEALDYVCLTASVCVLIIKNSKSNSVPIILAIVGLMLVTVVAGVLIVKKYVCGGR